MVSRSNHRSHQAEFLACAVIVATWPLWLVGGLYIAGPVLGIALTALALYEYFCAPTLPVQRRLPVPHWSVQLWIAAMLLMLIVLWIGHSEFSLGTGQTIKSSVGWAKGWMLIALFIFVGAVLPIRRRALIRAICQLGRHCCWLFPLFLAAPHIGLPEMLWVSPLKVLGGSGDEYFAAILFTREPGVGTPRWQFFAPWSPAIGLIGLIYFLAAMQESNRRWRYWGMAGALGLILLSQSRLALVGIALLVPLIWAIGRLTKPGLWILAVPAVVLLGWVGPDALDFANQLQNDFANARADSSRVRAALGRIAVERWYNEAYWFGHGIVERGPHLVEYMPIGSHHSWYGLLFVKGLIGLLALAVPLMVSLLLLLRSAPFDRRQRLPLAMVLLLLLYSFGENLEILAYLYWPALVIIGQGLQRLTFRAR